MGNSLADLVANLSVAVRIVPQLSFMSLTVNIILSEICSHNGILCLFW